MLISNSPLLRLPPEIRNQIMLLVLRPGHIYLHQTLTFNERICRQGIMPERVNLMSKGSNSGPNVLATCRQLYRECHEIYYSSNVFHIPTSSIKIMQPNHRALVQHVGLSLSLLDVMPSKTEEIETLAKGVQERSGDPSYISENSEIYSLCCGAVLLGVWLSNISSIQESFPGLKTLYVEIRAHTEPQMLLRLAIAAENINSPVGYSFKSFDYLRDEELARLKRKWYEKLRLDRDLGVFLDFGSHQLVERIYYDMTFRPGSWATFKDSINADSVKDYDDEILGEGAWSWAGWEAWKKRINEVAELVEVV